jgi:hypothetical protein
VLFDSLEFPNGVKFRFGISIGSLTSAQFLDNHLMVQIKTEEAKQWIYSDQVSLSNEITLQSGKLLTILIEKDFPCKHTGDDFEDTYHELQPEEHKMYKKTVV